MKVMVIAPHPDDEILGVGGTLMRRKASGAAISCVFVTGISTAHGWPAERVAERAAEIRNVAELIGFDEVIELNFPTTKLDTLAIGDLVGALSTAIKNFEPNEVFVPHPSDIHTDHRVAFDAAASCVKWFRYPSIRRVLAYETLSETDFGLGVDLGFRPNVFEDISVFLDLKLQAMSVYASEMGAAPFPRSAEVIRALAIVRGAASGFRAAEAFQLLTERA